MRLAIDATTTADLAELRGLWNDGRVMGSVGFPDGLGYDDDAMQAWLARVDASGDLRHFTIRDEDGRFCGELFYSVDRAHRRAELDVKLLPAAQGRGIATTGLTWLVEHVFDHEPDVDAVWTEPWPENAPARALYARCGLAPAERPADLGPGPSYFERRRRAAG